MQICEAHEVEFFLIKRNAPTFSILFQENSPENFVVIPSPSCFLFLLSLTCFDLDAHSFDGVYGRGIGKGEKQNTMWVLCCCFVFSLSLSFFFVPFRTIGLVGFLSCFRFSFVRILLCTHHFLITLFCFFRLPG